MSRARLPLVAALLAAVGLVTLATAPAWAHVSLVASNPADGARLAAPPTQVVLRFSSEVAAPASVVVTAPDGTRSGTGGARVDGDVVTQAVAAGGGPGSYTVAYRAISVDGHEVTGEIGFQVGTASGAPDATAVAPPSAPEEGGTSTPIAADRATPPAATPTGRGLAIGVGAGLFALAGLLLLLSRRVAP